MRTRCAIATGVNAGLVDVLLTDFDWQAGSHNGKRLHHGRNPPRRGEARARQDNG
jgi:hypothetical protein